MDGLVSSGVLVGGVVLFVLVAVPVIVANFLRNVEAGTIRLVSWLGGGTVIYRGPGKSKEIPLLTTGTTISSKVINVDLDITDQTADIDDNGTPRPIKVRVLASAIVSVGDSDVLIKTAANRFFSKSEADQLNTLTDLLSSSGRRAINLLTHDQLFSAKATPSARRSLQCTASNPSGRRRRQLHSRCTQADTERHRGRRRSARRHHPEGVLARAHRPRTDLQFAQHQGRAVGSRRSASPSVGGRSAGQRGHRRRRISRAAPRKRSSRQSARSPTSSASSSRRARRTRR